MLRLNCMYDCVYVHITETEKAYVGRSERWGKN